MSALSDDELEARLYELSAEKEAREEGKRARAAEARVLRMRTLQQMVHAYLNVIEPSHHTGRYGSVCGDEKSEGAFRTLQEPKDTNCLRCRLLRFLQCDDAKLQHVNFGISVRW